MPSRTAGNLAQLLFRELGIGQIAVLINLLHSVIHDTSPCLIRPDATTAPVSPVTGTIASSRRSRCSLGNKEAVPQGTAKIIGIVTCFSPSTERTRWSVPS